VSYACELWALSLGKRDQRRFIPMRIDKLIYMMDRRALATATDSHGLARVRTTRKSCGVVLPISSRVKPVPQPRAECTIDQLNDCHDVS
jgi:hypothetical protein